MAHLVLFQALRQFGKLLEAFSLKVLSDFELILSQEGVLLF